jgi:hypothetical protein
VTAVDFPRRLLREKRHAWNLAGVAATPGANGRSVASYVRSDGGGAWTCSMTDVSLSGNGSALGKDRQKQSTLLWRAVRQLADGGASELVVPRNDALFNPWPDGVSRTPILSRHSDGTTFSDGTSYYQSTIVVLVEDAADLRAVSLDIEVLVGSSLGAGESFSILHPTMGWRLYEIRTVAYSDDTHATITFRPPLREQVYIGTELEFDRPRCTMRLASPNSMDLWVQPWTFNSASVDFVEAFPDEL